MILAEKITKLRKEKGWSQEELAAQLNISRQSVSKWESMTSVPDLDKIIKMSQVFGVSTDYLLKDEMEEVPEVAPTVEKENMTIHQERKVSIELANDYMETVRYASKKIALGVAACILSPVILILLAGLYEYQVIALSENMVAGVGVTMLLLFIAGGVATFILQGMQLSKYEYLQKEPLALDYGVASIVQTKLDAYEPVFKKSIAVGVSLCITSIVPILIAVAFDAPEVVYVYCVGLLFGFVAFGVYLFVSSGMVHGSYQQLLEEGDFTREKKSAVKKNEAWTSAYWCVVVAGYLLYSFVTNDWHISWVVWPVAGILYAAVQGIVTAVRK